MALLKFPKLTRGVSSYRKRKSRVSLSAETISVRIEKGRISPIQFLLWYGGDLREAKGDRPGDFSLESNLLELSK